MQELFKRLGIVPHDLSIYEQALTHSSYANENKVEHNERLEFLGDAVIQLIISDFLYKHDLRDQGVLTKKRAQTVREEALHLFATKIHLKQYIKLGRGEIERGANQSMIADAYEALFAAIYLDLGFQIAFSVFEQVMLPHLSLVETLKDYKTQLQELIQLERRSLTYHTVKIGGPSNHPEFKSEVYLEDDILLGSGIGLSKKEAEQKAAQEALSKVVKEY